MSKKIFPIVGSMGVGKTTFVDNLRKIVPSVIYLAEPVDQWLSIVDQSNGENLLNRLYRDPHRWALTFEMIAHATRWKQLMTALKSPESSVIVIDGALSVDKSAYAQKLYDEGSMDSMEWHVYNIWNQFCVDQIQQHEICYIYLRCDPVTTLQRVSKRNRPEEKTLCLPHFEQLQHYLDQWVTEQKETNATIQTYDFNCDVTDPRYTRMLRTVADLLTI
jgi:deoxyadenosine/deoxycytidine kinase